MRRFTQFLILSAALFAVTACNNGGDVKPVNKPDSQATTEDKGPDKETPIPDSLKHEGFKYYGLESEKENTYEVKLNNDTQTGGQKTTYLGMVDGKPRYQTDRSEGLAQLGTEIIEVREDGVYTVSAREQTLEAPMLGLPAKIETGKTWEIKEKLKDPNGNDVEVTATNKIEAPEKITVAGQTYDCIVISMKGKMTTQGKSQDVDGKTYFAAGIGTVKLTVNYTATDGTKNTYQIQLKKASGTAEKPAE